MTFRENAGNGKNQIPNLGAVRSSRAGGTSKITQLWHIAESAFFVKSRFGTRFYFFPYNKKGDPTTPNRPPQIHQIQRY